MTRRKTARHPANRRPPAIVRLTAGLAGALALGGCTGFSEIAGDVGAVGVGAVVGGLTGNPLIGFAAGAGAQLALSEGVDYYQREAVDLVHEAIAETAGEAPAGERRAWTVDSTLPLVEAGGEVQVLRDFGGDIPCRELVFTDDDIDDTFFIAVVCQGEDGRWRWAVAEPSTDRWSGLQ